MPLSKIQCLLFWHFDYIRKISVSRHIILWIPINIRISISCHINYWSKLTTWCSRLDWLNWLRSFYWLTRLRSLTWLRIYLSISIKISWLSAESSAKSNKSSSSLESSLIVLIHRLVNTDNWQSFPWFFSFESCRIYWCF